MRTVCWIAASLLWTGVATAQAPGPSPEPGQPLAPGQSTPVAPGGNGAGTAPSTDTTTTTTTYLPFGVPAPGTDINAGLPSSSRPKNGDQSDSFDLGRPSTGGGVVYGTKDSAAVLGDERPVTVPDVHLVKKGDTLWDLCDHYYHNPWEWPQVWSYNPQIQNPNWIYPGDQLRLRHPGEIGGAGDASSRALAQPFGGGSGSGGNRSRVAPDTLFLRDQGFIGDPKRDIWGELVGAVEEQMLLSDGNHVYLYMREGIDLKIGQELTVFREVRQPEHVPGARKPPGQVVAVNGTVRIDRWDPKTRVARALVTESVDAIERGAKVGPVGRRFDVVARRPNTKNVEARVLTSLYPHVYLAQNQVVFIDRGSSDGLEPGNTLLILRRGDTWRNSLTTNSKMVRDRVRMDSPERVDIETTPLRGDPEKFPDEAVAELRVLRAEKFSSIALVTQSRREVVPGDRAVGVAGK